MSDRPLIVALDHPSPESALELAAALDPQTCRLKVANTLFVRGGPAFVEALAARCFDVFLDLKFHDIPVQVAGACRSAADMGVWMMNVHVSGGTPMLEAARGAVSSARSGVLLIGVTILTSLDDADLARVGVQGPPEMAVLRLAGVAAEAGLDGVVCSAEELTALRSRHPSPFLCVTPGIRPSGTPGVGDDQKRVMTPAAAIRAGADYLVVGRPVTGASDPQAAVASLNSEIARARAAA